jgi:hypothetical protein
VSKRRKPRLGRSFTLEVTAIDIEAAIREDRFGVAIERALRRAFPGATDIRHVDYGTDASGRWHWRSGAGQYGPFPTREAAEEHEQEFAEAAS